ncbi:MAG: type I phosphomannose isomerase catalytic subunit [Nonlabens sp.]|uniref:type I phosphomannose isomerase catalytic subunit n=1 Tax=Nonlabens sp. TaxID=1888209 RepID=UPI003EF17881
MQLYPLSFKPILKDKLWGGEELNKLKNVTPAVPQLGESWEISVVENDISVVENGPYSGQDLNQLIHLFPKELLGNKVIENFGEQFPLLIKYINAAKDLSIQVHPDDSVALKKHNSFGKTEMWYIMDAVPDSRLILGFKNDCTQDAFAEAISQNTVLDLLNEIQVKTGDAFFIKPGLIHAIGAGITLAEIQQSSDITYRVYDFDRKDDQGNTRELHIKDSIEVSNYKESLDHVIPYNPEKVGQQNLASNQYFTTDYLHFTGCNRLAVSEHDSFMVLMNVGESCEVICNGIHHQLDGAQTILIPAAVPYVLIKASKEAKLLSVHL